VKDTRVFVEHGHDLMFEDVRFRHKQAPPSTTTTIMVDRPICLVELPCFVSRGVDGVCWKPGQADKEEEVRGEAR
jgi:hypothetical protein